MFEADLEDALDSLGFFNQRDYSYPPQRRGPDGEPIQRECIENPFGIPTSNPIQRTSLLVGPRSESNTTPKDDESFHNSVQPSASLMSAARDIPNTPHDLSSKISIESSEIGRQSETEFRLYLDRNGQDKDPSRTQSDSRKKSTDTTVPKKLKSDEGARDRLKKNLLSRAFGAKGRFKPVTTVPNDFIFKDYLPQLFAEVRETCGIDPQEYADSFQKTTKEKFSEGRSGAFLYFSSDQKYIVKTTTKSENQALLDIMQDYLSYLIANPNSLIVRFLGAHSLTLYGRVLYFVVMLNVFSKAELSERYDLKGSWVQRHGDDFYRRQKLKSKSAPLYKDNDLQHKIALVPDVANALHDQIFRDTAFLSGE